MHMEWVCFVLTKLESNNENTATQQKDTNAIYANKKNINTC